MSFRIFSKWALALGILTLLLVKLYIRPYVHTEGSVKFIMGIAPNFMGAFLMPFGANWLYTHPRFFNGSLRRYPFFSDTRIICLFGFVLIVINEYLQLIPIFGRTFDYFDIVFSAIGMSCAFYVFTLFQKRLSAAL
jgi:hypothetical protein